jgi:hypothetical protein
MRPVTVLDSDNRATSARCRRCGTSTPATVCPHCHAPLQPGWLHTSTTCIALAGARASGKSIYIAVLKRQAELLAEMMGSSMGYFDPATERTYNRVYQTPLYQERGLMPATARHETPDATQRAPLIFTMGTINGREHRLVIRDVAGENLEDPSSDQYVFGFFRHADGVFFLFDPMRVDAIRNQLAGVVPEQRAVGGDPLDVLNNLVRLLRTGSGPIQTPLALVLAKFDILYELRHVAGSPLVAAMRNPGAAYSRDPSLESVAYNWADGLLLDAEVDSLLARLGAQQLLNVVRNEFAGSRTFAVSALGAAPTGQTLHPRGIAPFRCLDPLKWVFARTGVLAAT